MGLDLVGGALAAAPVALIAWRLGALTVGGAVSGFLCAVAIYLGAYLAGLAVLGAALLLTVASSRLGRARKVALGISEDRVGQRGTANVLANCGVAAIAGLLAAFSHDWSGEAGAILLVTGITAGASDTVASEVGKAFGAQPRAFPTFRRVPAGTPGAVSPVGTMTGVAAAIVIASPAAALFLLPAERIPLIAIACTAGAFIESTLASGFEKPGVLANHLLNFVNTASAALLALWWAAR